MDSPKHPAVEHLRHINSDKLWQNHVAPRLFPNSDYPQGGLESRILLCYYGHLPCYKVVRYVRSTYDTLGNLASHSFRCSNCRAVAYLEERRHALGMNTSNKVDATIHISQATFDGWTQVEVGEIKVFRPPPQDIYRLVEKDVGRDRITTTELLTGDDVVRYWLRGLVDPEDLKSEKKTP